MTDNMFADDSAIFADNDAEATDALHNIAMQSPIVRSHNQR